MNKLLTVKEIGTVAILEFSKSLNKLEIKNTYPVLSAKSIGDVITINDKKVKLNQWKHVTQDYSTSELALSIKIFSERYIQPAMRDLAYGVKHKSLNYMFAFAPLHDNLPNVEAINFTVNNINIRVLSQYDITSNKLRFRYDVLFGLI